MATWKVPTDLERSHKVMLDAIDSFKNELSEFIGDKRDEFDGMSDKWREGEKAESVESWLSAALDDIESKCDEVFNDLDGEFPLAPDL